MKDNIEGEKLIVKRTFEDVLNAQEELRDTLEILAKENRCLTEEEKGIFLRQLSHATFGLGREIEYEITISPYTGPETFGNVEYMARKLAIETNKLFIFKRRFDYTDEVKKFEIPISKFWEALLFSLFEVFPLALDRASAMSKEMDAAGGGEPYEFKPKK